jgi:molecular chaperone HscB
MSLSRAVEVNEAYRTLKDDLSRGKALLTALGSPQPESGATGEGDATEPPDPAFLMEVMELREALAEARAGADAATVARLAKRVSETMRETRAAVAARFAEAEAGNQAALDQAAVLLSRMRYYRRFLDEVAVIEEEALG